MKSFSSFNSNESINEESRAESGALFKSLVDKAHASSEAGNHTQAKRHLANAQTARYGITSANIAKHKKSFDKYKELSHSYTNSDEHVREETEKEDINEEYHVVANKSYYGDKSTPVKLSSHKTKDEADAALTKHKQEASKTKGYGAYADRWHKTVDDAGLKKHMNEDISIDEENLDELSNKLLNRYSKKAEKEAGKNFMAADRAQDRGNYDKAQTHMDKADKRASGVYRAQSKIKEESLDEISKDTLSSYAHKAFAQGNDLHYDLAHSKGNKATDAERQAIKDKISKRNSGVIKASQKMNKEDMDEAVDTVKRDEKGKVIAWSHEGDWQKMSTKNKQGSGKAANLAGKAMQKTKQLSKEEVEEIDEKAAAGDWHVHDSKTDKIHSTYSTHKKAISAMNKLNSQHDGYETPGGIIQGKFKASAASYHKEDINESEWGKDKMSSLRQAHDRHMEKALAANKAGDDTAVKTHQRKMQMIQGKMQKLKQNEEVELGEECEILLGEAAHTDVAAVKAKYKQNEDDNRHTENAELLAKHFGSKSDQNKVAKAKAYRDRNNGYSGDAEGRMHSNLAHEVHSKLYHHIKEEVEELDELDKKTLGSYISKSHDQLMKHTGSVNMKFGRGDKDAVAYSLDKTALRKTANRTKGMDTALNKLTKEEVEAFMQTEAYEQLDELDKDTLKSYIGKASQNARIQGMMQMDYKHKGDKARNPGTKKAYDKMSDDARSKGWKRQDGIKTAANKLTKEDTMLTYSEFMAQLAEGKADDLRDKLAADRERRLDKYDYSKEKDSKVSPVKNVKGHSYGAGEDSEEGEDEVKTAKPAAVKRGRGRPAGSKSGARV